MLVKKSDALPKKLIFLLDTLVYLFIIGSSCSAVGFLLLELLFLGSYLFIYFCDYDRGIYCIYKLNFSRLILSSILIFLNTLRYIAFIWLYSADINNSVVNSGDGPSGIFSPPGVTEILPMEKDSYFNIAYVTLGYSINKSVSSIWNVYRVFWKS